MVSSFEAGEPLWAARDEGRAVFLRQGRLAVLLSFPYRCRSLGDQDTTSGRRHIRRRNAGGVDMLSCLEWQVPHATASGGSN